MMNDLEMMESSRDAWMKRASIEISKFNIIEKVLGMFEIKRLNKIDEYIESLQDANLGDTKDEERNI